MEEIIIREATALDMETLLRFEQGIINAERSFDTTLKREDTRYYDLEKMITSPHIHLLLAVSGNKIIGSGYARIERAKPFLQHTQHSYLGFMYVESEYRGRGINKLIIDRLKEWSAAQNITELRLEVYEQNSSAIKAYEKIGFTRHMIEMRMGLAGK